MASGLTAVGCPTADSRGSGLGSFSTACVSVDSYLNSAVPAVSPQAVARKVPARLLAELQEVRSISEIEGRLLTGITDLFGELAKDERHRRQAWEEKADRNARELRAGVDTDLARGACEARRLLAEAKKDAAEARRLAQPCMDLLASLDNNKLPAKFAQVISQEALEVASAEIERATEGLRQELNDVLKSAIHGHAEQFKKALTDESGRWAEACASQLAEGFYREQQAREKFKAAIESKMLESGGNSERLREEMRTAVAQTCADAEARLGAHLQELQAANVSLQTVLERYTEHWERAWHEETQARVNSDCETTQRLEILVRASEAQVRTMEAAIQRVDAGLNYLGLSIGREENVRQETDSQLLAALCDLQGELRTEADRRSCTDIRLANNVQQLRVLVNNVVKQIGTQTRIGSTLNGDGSNLPAESGSDIVVQTTTVAEANADNGESVHVVSRLPSFATLPEVNSPRPRT